MWYYHRTSQSVPGSGTTILHLVTTGCSISWSTFGSRDHGSTHRYHTSRSISQDLALAPATCTLQSQTVVPVRVTVLLDCLINNGFDLRWNPSLLGYDQIARFRFPCLFK